MSPLDRFWAWAAARRDRLVTAALDDHDDTDREWRRLLDRLDDDAA